MQILTAEIVRIEDGEDAGKFDLWIDGDLQGTFQTAAEAKACIVDHLTSTTN